MNDRIPGTTWDNPIWHKGYRIYLSDLYETHGFEYDYAHDSYDGAPDARDGRCGQAHTVEQAKAEIDERVECE